MLKPKKKKVSWTDIVELIPDESSIKDLKAKPEHKKSKFPDTHSKETKKESTSLAASNYERIKKLLLNGEPPFGSCRIHMKDDGQYTLDYLDDYLTALKNNEKSVQEKRERVESFLKAVINNNELCMEVNPGHAENTIKDIILEGFVERTKHSLGSEDKSKRAALIFGYPKVPFSGDTLSNYGYLRAKHAKKPTYSVKFIFNKTKLFNRTTMTVGDSWNNLDNGIIASRLTNPKIESIPGVAKGNIGLLEVIDELICDGEITSDMDPMLISKKITAEAHDLGVYKGDIEHFELQYHGYLTMKDIDSCEIPFSMTDQMSDKIEAASGVKPIRQEKSATETDEFIMKLGEELWEEMPWLNNNDDPNISLLVKNNFVEIVNWLMGVGRNIDENKKINPIKDVPKSLEYLDDYLEKIKNSEKFVEENRQTVEDFFKEMISKNELGMEVSDNDLIISNIISDHFKNAFETYPQSSYEYLNQRKDINSLVFGMPKNVVENVFTNKEESQLEKYGYLAAHGSLSRAGYGCIKFFFKKTPLLNRTTMTVGDSWHYRSAGIIASKLTNPKAESIPGVAKGSYRLLRDICNLINNGEIKPNMDPLDIAKKISAKAIYSHISYFELQYHGDLKMKDVESCELPADTVPIIKDAIKGAGVSVKEV